MAWYSDEQYAMIEDSREKKSTAASAFKQRTHCGKSGGVRLPSDSMTKKERNAMNGECVVYRMNDPIAWSEFKTWPEEHQKSYIVNAREKFKVPNTALAKAMGVSEGTLNGYIKCFGLNQGKESGANGRYWHNSDDATRFWAWWNGEEVVEAEAPDLRKPMSWDQFKSMSAEQKKDYIEWIRYFFEAPDKYIARDLFRVCDLSLRRQLIELDLIKPKGTSKKVWGKDSFLAWCEQNKKKPVEGPVTKVEAVAPVETLIDEPCELVEEDFDDGVEEMTMPEFSEDPITEAFKKACSNIEAAEKKYYSGIPCELAGNCERKMIYDAGPIAFMGNRVPVIPKSGSMTFCGNRAEDILATLKTLLGDARVNLTVSWECEF